MSLPSPFSAATNPNGENSISRKNEAARNKRKNKKKKLTELNRQQLLERRELSNQRRFQTFALSLNSCKYCNINFDSQNELQHHRRSHTQCPYDECQFNANEATVANHIQYVHLKANALVKIQDLSTPEQIEKWREERRKRYPTTANVQLRQQIQEIKQKRGEKLQDAKGRFGDHQQRDFVKNMGNKDKKRPQNQHQPRANPRQRQNQRDFKEQVNKACEIIQKILPPEKHDTAAPLKFKGTQQLKDYHKEEKNIGGLSLLAAYGSDSESENESLTNDHEIEDEERNEETLMNNEEIKNEEVDIAMKPIEAIKEENVEICEGIKDEEIDDEAPPKEEPTQRDDTQPNFEKNTRPKRKQAEGMRNNTKKVQRTALDYSKLRQIKSTNPFLEKLLHREIVHERNYLLQCVNYVVKNNFFGIGQDAECSKNVKDDKNA